MDDCELNPREAYRDNVAATNVLVEALQTIKPLFIYVSTDYVFDGAKKSAYDESDRPAPLNVYGRTKWLGEEIVRKSNLPWLIIRTSWLYGKNGANFVKAILKLAGKRRELKVVTDQMGAPTYTKDLALGIQKLIEIARAKRIRNQIFNLTNSGKTSWNGFAKQILKESGKIRIVVKPVVSSQFPRPAARPANSVLSNRKFIRTAGWTMRSWQEALKDYLKEL